MKYIDPQFITSTAWQPFEQITWEVLQLSYLDAIAQTIIAQIGVFYDASTVYALWGCVPTVGVSSTTISAGAVFTNGEVFLFPGQTLTNPTGSNVIVANLAVTYLDTDSGSGTLFSDGSFHQVHDDRKVGFSSAGVSGTGNINGGASSNNDLANFFYVGRFNVDSAPNVTGTTLSFDFLTDRYIKCLPNTVASITLPSTGNIGAEVIIAIVNVGIPVSLTFTTVAGQTIKVIYGSPGNPAGDLLIITIKYCGFNVYTVGYAN